jgi:hypothetical protein
MRCNEVGFLEDYLLLRFFVEILTRSKKFAEILPEFLKKRGGKFFLRFKYTYCNLILFFIKL